MLPMMDAPDGDLLASARNRNPTTNTALVHRPSAACLTFDLSDCSVTRNCLQSVVQTGSLSAHRSTTLDQSLLLASSLPRTLAVDAIVNCHFGAFSPG